MLPRVLIIEDNAADIELLKSMLTEDLGPYHFEVLQDGESALAFIRGHREKKLGTDPCVIVLDLGLPLHSGITVLEELRRSPALTHIQVVVLSSFAPPAERERVRSLGGLFREKPSDLDAFAKLAAFIAEVCRGGPKPAADGAAAH